MTMDDVAAVDLYPIVYQKTPEGQHSYTFRMAWHLRAPAVLPSTSLPVHIYEPRP